MSATIAVAPGLAAAGLSKSVPSLSQELVGEVLRGLTRRGQKTLPASWLYDAIGSALFEVITLLPEYGLTRADAGLLERKADEIVAAGSPGAIVELGSGSGTKTRFLLEAAVRQQSPTSLGYFPIDISSAALESCAKVLAAIEDVAIQPIEASYLEGIRAAVSRRRGRERLMLLFLGSTIGNLSPAEAAGFLRAIRRLLQPGDTMLIGADLVKPEARLLRAYDDPTGVTAAFNLNLLGRINRELGGDFCLARFRHEASWNPKRSRVEMHLRSLEAQRVRIAAFDLEIAFRAEETIWTESSYKFEAGEIPALAARAGWHTVSQWIDYDWGFAETLLAVPRIAKHG